MKIEPNDPAGLLIGNLRSTEESPSGATMAGRRPYKCPCCDGYGRRQVIRQMMTAIIYEPCQSCAGTGVVWG